MLRIRVRDTAKLPPISSPALPSLPLQGTTHVADMPTVEIPTSPSKAHLSLDAEGRQYIKASVPYSGYNDLSGVVEMIVALHNRFVLIAEHEPSEILMHWELSLALLAAGYSRMPMVIDPTMEKNKICLRGNVWTQ